MRFKPFQEWLLVQFFRECGMALLMLFTLCSPLLYWGYRIDVRQAAERRANWQELCDRLDAIEQQLKLIKGETDAV